MYLHGRKRAVNGFFDKMMKIGRSGPKTRRNINSEALSSNTQLQLGGQRKPRILNRFNGLRGPAAFQPAFGAIDLR